MRLKNIILVSASTMGSRLMGLFRDSLTLALLGLSAVNSAFIFAFTIPNLFRRLLGEGALTSALIPIFSNELEKKGKNAAFQFVNQTLSWASLVFLSLTALGMVASYCLYKMEWLEGRYHLGVQYLIILFPYMICVCLAALITAILNVLNHFGTASLSQVWLNSTMLGALGIAKFLGKGFEETAIYLCIGVIIGGCLQVLIPAIRFYQIGWIPSINFGISKALMDLVKLLLPGIIGASIFQINTVASRFFAFSTSDEGISILYIVNRLIELPLGVFAIAITTVLFPEIAKLVIQDKLSLVGQSYTKGLRLIFIITIPASIGLMVLSEPILRALFEWEHFNEENVLATQPILMIAALGLPFYGMSTLAIRCLHGLKDMRTPYKVAIRSFFVNALFSLILGNTMGISGIALANLVAAIYQAFALHLLLVKKNVGYEKESITFPVIKIIVAALVMGVHAYGIYYCLGSFIDYKKLADFLTISVGISLSIVIYLFSIYLLGLEEKDELKVIFARIKAKFN